MNIDLNKYIDSGKPNQKRLKRVVNDNKVGLSILGGAVTTLAVGVGVLGTALFNKKKVNTYKQQIDELETENQRLEAILVDLNKSIISGLGLTEEEFDELEDYEPSEFESYHFSTDISEYVGDGEESLLFITDISDFDSFQQQRAESLERDGDKLLKFNKDDFSVED